MSRIVMISLAALALTGAAPATPPLTADGWGELKIGMREAEAVRRFKLIVPSSDDGVSSDACRELTFPKSGPDLVVMAEEGRVTRISAYGDSAARTDRGFGIGSREADIRKAYGVALKVEPHKYDDLPAHYLTAWSIAGKRGVRYETNQKRVVTTVHVGGPSIQYIEGCL